MNLMMPGQLLFWLTCLFLSGCALKENRLAKASSPYLQQHADNPVDWYEWGEQALQKAKKENKPLLISVGYASCHWCHQMEKESFMDTAVARLMNENFVCIKVDKEQRPDIDAIYMNACEMISGSSGWPLNAFALPDGKPFFAGTYYSKPSWTSLLKKIAQAYREQHSKVVLQANGLTNGIAKLEVESLNDISQKPIVDPALYYQFYDSLSSKLDLVNGGLRGTPKFPIPVVTELLLQYASITDDKNALTAVNNWLTKMALGGIYDQAGGGFARYSVDSLWKVPHFEKMLYDNAQLLSVYAHAYQMTQNPFFKNIVREIAAFVEKDLTAENGGFYSSLNAVTSEGDGVFYSWTHDEFEKVAGHSSKLLSDYYNVTARGNWKDGRNILLATSAPGEFALANNLQPNQFYNLITANKKNLLAERDKREKPEVDRKILASWNALMMLGYLEAYAALNDPAYLGKALSNAQFIEKNLIVKQGQLWRNFINGEASIPAFLEDYALLAKAYIRLYQLTFDKHWLSLAQQLTAHAVENFYDEQSGMFFSTEASRAGVVVRKMALVDDAIPSANATMAQVLYELSVYFENDTYLKLSTRMMSRVGEQMLITPQFYARWGWLVGSYANGSYEVAICGKDALAKNLDLQKHFLPLNIYFGTLDEENLSLLKGKVIDNKTLIYACVNRACKQPVETAEKALQQLRLAKDVSARVNNLQVETDSSKTL